MSNQYGKNEYGKPKNVSADQRFQAMPDISHEEKPQSAARLDGVGMSGIEIPVLIKAECGTPTLQPARIDAYVSLDDKGAKGIHMSRLYLALQEILAEEVLSLFTIKKVLQKFVESQKGISENAFLKISYDLMVQRKALLSERLGWRQYPVALSGSLKSGVCEFEVSAQVAYSSTCPCSAALARQLIQNQFCEEFDNQSDVPVDVVRDWLGEASSIVATPHAQRSYADFKVKVDDGQVAPSPLQLIDLIEGAVKTPVQSAVKRQDEQEFARLNGSNLMFCEDAARRVKQALGGDPRILDYWVKVDHVESLHPHSAVSVVTKGVEGGYQI